MCNAQIDDQKALPALHLRVHIAPFRKSWKGKLISWKPRGSLQ